MPFHTDLTEDDVLSIVCEHDGCTLDKLQINFRVQRKTAAKFRVTIDADPDLKIVKTKKKRRKPDERQKRKPGRTRSG